MPLFGGATAIDPAHAVTWFANFWDKVIPVLEARLAEHGKKFLAGTDRPTIADFKAFQTVIMNLDSNSACVLPADVRATLKQKMQASPGYYRWVQNMEQELSAYISSGRVPTPF